MFVGCATQSREFFGINMKDVSKHEKFYMKLNEETLDDSTDWQYWHDRRTMDKNLRAYATFSSGETFSISVYNDTPSPIATNYFLDEFGITDIIGSTYMIEKPDILSYPSVSYINPNQSVNYHSLKLPIDRSNIATIIVGIGGKSENYIVLKRIPKP